MKRISSLLSAFIILLSAVACGSTTNTPSDTTVPTVTDDTATSEVITTTEDTNKLPNYIPTDTYDGHEFIVLMTNLNSNTAIVRDFKWTEGGTVLDDALYTRNMQAMDTLDIVITGIEKYSSPNTGAADVRKANSAGDSNYDMCIISTYDCGSLALSGDLRDLNDFGCLDLSQAWWDQNMNRDLPVNGKLYFTTGDISLVATCAMYNMVFNKDMFRENNWEMPYEMVRQGKWTFDVMKEYILQVSEDLDGNEIMDAKDRYGLVYINSGIVGALGASGERMGKVDESGNVVLGLGTAKAEQAIVSYLELISDKNHTFNGQTSGVNSFDMFIEGHCLFRWSEHIAFPHFRDTELDYGILPLPKLDENQDRYYTPFGGWDAAFVCIPTSTENDERTSAIIEYLAFTSKHIVTPAYYERTLTGRYVRDTDSYDMITIEMENRGFDLGYIYNIGGIKDMVANLPMSGTTSFASKWESYRTAAETACKTVNETLNKDK
ncbi:MAG: hypothetical protein IIV03_03760 [Clostridia bacterium]|nr:hypothetical protein [Clostridia bacterium]MBQ1934092.1 hypothetical protein [Clostridia bacterium]MBQ5649237.1 hypothetical protein [Clostridia bacterium]MBR0327518.1 hypothetical protein [Clostridia bacterium]